MKRYKYALIFPIFFLLIVNLGCDNESNSNANAQPTPMSGTDVTGKVNAPSKSLAFDHFETAKKAFTDAGFVISVKKSDTLEAASLLIRIAPSRSCSASRLCGAER